MVTIVSAFTVFFEQPFWVGVYERRCRGRYEVCKVTFGAEPKDYEVYDFLLCHYGRLRFCSTAAASELETGRVNPKRMQREIGRQLRKTGVGTKAQEELRLQREQGKQVRRAVSRTERTVEKERRFRLAQGKKKQKRRGH